MYAINVYDKIPNVNRSCAANELHLVAVAGHAFFSVSSRVQISFFYSRSRFGLSLSLIFFFWAFARFNQIHHGWVDWVVLQQRTLKWKLPLNQASNVIIIEIQFSIAPGQTKPSAHFSFLYSFLLLVGRSMGRSRSYFGHSFISNDIDKMNHSKWWVD